MSNDATALRRTAVAAEREWARQGWPDKAHSSLGHGCCYAAFCLSAKTDMSVCERIAEPECVASDYLHKLGAHWGARILWLYVIAHAVEEGCA